MTSPYVDSKATGTYHGFLLDGFTLRMKEKIYMTSLRLSIMNRLVYVQEVLIHVI